jgi:dTDP-4-dehydrorhamnose reductase
MSVYDKVIITGGKGMLAYALDRTLRERGHPPLLVDRATLDVTNRDAIVELFAREKPTLVLNCAAFTKVDLCETEQELANLINGKAAGELAYESAQHEAKFVHFSTDYVFDGSLRRPLRPDDPVGPQSAYGSSKLMGEELVRDLGAASDLIIRTAWMYGPNGTNFVKTMVNVAKAGKPLRVVNDQIGSPTYTLDLAAATVALVDAGARGIWHLSNAGETTWFDFARAIFEEWGLKPDLQPTTSDAWKAGRPDIATRPAYSVLDVTPYAERIGRPMRHWREALAAFKVEVDRSGTF